MLRIRYLLNTKIDRPHPCQNSLTLYFIKYFNSIIVLVNKYITDVLTFVINVLNINFTERGGSVVTNETRIREVPGSNSGVDQPN